MLPTQIGLTVLRPSSLLARTRNLSRLSQMDGESAGVPVVRVIVIIVTVDHYPFPPPIFTHNYSLFLRQNV
jgi:hypothetical protein